MEDGALSPDPAVVHPRHGDDLPQAPRPVAHDGPQVWIHVPLRPRVHGHLQGYSGDLAAHVGHSIPAGPAGPHETDRLED